MTALRNRPYIKPATALPSSHQIGASVSLIAEVVGVRFTEDKVYYVVSLADDTEIEVDSYCVADRFPSSPPTDNAHVAPGCEQFPA